MNSMLDLDKQSGAFLYRQVIDLITENIDSGTLRPGDRLPSLRRMSKTAGVSVPTVRQAYVELERQRRVESRPQSGFYVRHRSRNDLVRASPGAAPDPGPLQCRSLMERVYEGVYNPDLVPLGIANPTMAKPATKALNRSMKRVMSGEDDSLLNYATSLGHPMLRRQIAWHYFDTIGAQVDPALGPPCTNRAGGPSPTSWTRTRAPMRGSSTQCSVGVRAVVAHSWRSASRYFASSMGRD